MYFSTFFKTSILFAIFILISFQFLTCPQREETFNITLQILVDQKRKPKKVNSTCTTGLVGSQFILCPPAQT